MKLTKVGKVVETCNPHTIAAFISEGWTELEESAPESEKAPEEAPKKRATRKKKDA